MSEHSALPQWDCRWPDPVALKVASERILSQRDMDDPGLNRRLNILVQMEPPPEPGGGVSAILVSPWAVERIYWHQTNQGEHPPILHAVDLEMDLHGRVAAGQGVILDTGEKTIPVIIGWEPETGHHFIATLVHVVRDFQSSEAALQHALGRSAPPKPQQSISEHLNHKINRRSLFGFLSRS